MVKGFVFTVKFWPKFHSLDDIAPNRAVFWVQAHGLPQNLCTFKTARYLGGKIDAVLEVEDPSESVLRLSLCLGLMNSIGDHDEIKKGVSTESVMRCRRS
ncbi:hypothetical protein ACFX1R_041745 [Malus domestica]